MDEFLLGLDIGTSSSKAVLAKADGAVVATMERAHGVSLPRPGWVEHDAEAVWWADVQALLARFDKKELASVKGLCVSGIGPCLCRSGPRGNRCVRPSFTASTPELLPRQTSSPSATALKPSSPVAVPRSAPRRWGRSYSGCAATARSLGKHPALLDGQLVRCTAPYRRVRARPSFGEPVQFALRPGLFLLAC